MEKLKNKIMNIFNINDLTDVEVRLRKLSKDLSKLENRENCPLCKQDIDKGIINDLINKIVEFKSDNKHKIESAWNDKIKRDKEIRKSNIEKRKIREIEIDNYIKLNLKMIKNKFVKLNLQI